MSLSTDSSFDVSVSEDRSLLPWVDESCTTLLLAPAPVDPSVPSQDLISFDSPTKPTACSGPPTSSLAPPAPPGLSAVPPVSRSPYPPAATQQHKRAASAPTSQACSLPLAPWFTHPPPKNIEADLRATVDALLKRRKDAQRGLVEENAALREEVGFLRNSLRLCSPEDSDAKQLAVALEQERTERLRSEEKLRALVQYLTEQVASGAGRRSVAEKALEASERDCLEWQEKVAAAMKRCEELEEENLRVKSLLGTFTRQRPAAVQQQMQGMLHDVAEERANLRRLEAIQQATEKARLAAQPEVKKTGTLNYVKRGAKKGKGYSPVQTDICWSSIPEIDD